MGTWQEQLELILFKERHDNVYRMEYYVIELIHPLFYSLTGLYIWAYNVVDFNLRVSANGNGKELILEGNRVISEQFRKNQEGLSRMRTNNYFITFEDHVSLEKSIKNFFLLFERLNENVLKIEAVKQLDLNSPEVVSEIVKLRTNTITLLKADWSLICDCYKEIMTSYVHGYRLDEY